MQKIIPHLWFDKEAKEAAEFYVSTFPDSKITSTVTLHNTPSGDCDIISFDLAGFSFMAMSAGQLFKINPSISFMVNFDPSRDDRAEEHLNLLWKKLSEGGTALMPLGEYPFSKRYGWVQDKFGVSWQLILTNPEGEERPFIIPYLMFTQEMCGKLDEATEFYLSIFKNAKRGTVVRYPAGMEPEKEGTIMFSDFQLEGQWFAAMESANEHKFKMNEAVSLIINCETQEEIDYYWEKLSAHPESEQCGWVKDKYGVSWQITPARMDSMLNNATPEQAERVTQALLQMKKIDLAALERAYAGDK